MRGRRLEIEIRADQIRALYPFIAAAADPPPPGPPAAAFSQVNGHRSQSEAEFFFRQMKDPDVVSFSPMFHWTGHNIRVHVLTCVLALQIAHPMRLQARRAGLRMSVRELLRQLAGIGEVLFPRANDRPDSPRLLAALRRMAPQLGSQAMTRS
jgi:hypothetical protein